MGNDYKKPEEPDETKIFGYYALALLFIVTAAFIYNLYLRIFTYSDAWFTACLMMGVLINCVVIKYIWPKNVKRLADLAQKQKNDIANGRVTKSNEINFSALALPHMAIFSVSFLAIFLALTLFPMGSLLHKLSLPETVTVSVSGKVNSCHVSRRSEGFMCLDILEPETLRGLSGIKIYETGTKVVKGQQVVTANINISHTWFGYFADRYQGLKAEEMQLGAVPDEEHDPVRNNQESSQGKKE